MILTPPERFLDMDPDQVVQHTLGLGPPLIRDNTVSIEMEEPHRLVLRAR